MSNWYIHDHQAEVLTGFQPEWLPPAAYRYVTPEVSALTTTSPCIRLRAGPYVGALPLQNGDTLYILPRAGREAFSRMLLVVEGLDAAVRHEFDDFSSVAHEESGQAPWTVLLARPFAHKLRLIERESLNNRRLPQAVRLGAVTGKVNPARTLKAIATREYPPVYSTLRPPTLLTLENRLLSSAAMQLLRVRSAHPSDIPVLVRWGALARHAYITQEELLTNAAALRTYRCTGSRSYYVPALVMARLILSQAGLALEGADPLESEPILTDIAALFERYVRVVLSRALSPLGFLVEKRDATAPAMFVDGTCKLVPDVVISRSGTPLLLLDAKYKPDRGVDPADYYQMAAYMEAYDLRAGLVVRAVELVRSSPLIRHETPQGRAVYELTIPLGNWERAEGALLASTTPLLSLGVNRAG